MLIPRLESNRPQINNLIANTTRGETRWLGLLAASKYTPDAIALNPSIEQLITQQEQGVFGTKADAIVVVDTATVAGGGPATWSLNNQEFLSSLAKRNNIPFVKVATGSGKPSFAVELTGTYVEPTDKLDYPANCKVPERFAKTSEKMTQVVRKLAQKGVRNIFALSEGYGGYGPFAMEVAIKRVEREMGIKLKANVAYQDNCVPDTDEPSWEIDKQTGYPSTRFYPGAYSGIPNQVNVFALGVFGTPVELGAEQTRAENFPGLKYLETAYNFTPEYMNRLQEYFLQLGPEQAREQLQKYLRLPFQDIPIVSSLGNGMYWQEQPWMTKAQQQDVLNGTDTMICALNIASQTIQKPIALVIAQEAADYIAKSKMADQVAFNENELSDSKRILVIPRPEIPQDAFLALKRMSAFEFARSRGNNAAAESAVLGVPLIALLLPDNNYMGVSQMDPNAANFGLPVFRPGDNAQNIAAIATNIITDPEYAYQQGRLEQQVFMDNYKTNNYFNVIKYLSGLN